MHPFVKLADPQTYVACPWDLGADAEGREYWVEFFKRHINTILKLGVEAGRKAYRAGRIEKKAYAAASSPTEGVATAAGR